MARNWRAEEDRRRDDRGYGRSQDDDRHSAYGEPRHMSGSSSYGSDFGSSDSRASWSGMDQSDYRGRSRGNEGYYDEGRRNVPSYDPQSGPMAHRSYEGFGGARHERPYDEDRMERGGRSPYRNRNWSGGRSDWGRQEWGMSGPQQEPRDYDRNYGRDERGFWDRATDEVASWFGDEDAERRRDQDQYRGKGPKNYSRSDDRIREDVSDRLTDDWRVDASEIEVAVEKGEVTLSGTVSDRMQRRRAEDIAESVSGARHVQNNLRVRDAQAGGMETGITAGQSSTISSRNT